MKLISLNIEGHKHLESRVIPFITSEQPDVVSFQEIFYVDIPLFVQKTGLQCVHFIPVADVLVGNRHIPDPLGWWGLAQFVKPGLKAMPLPALYYRKAVGETILDTTISLEQLRELWKDHPVPEFMGDLNPNAAEKVILQMNVMTEKENYFRFMTTHFTWSPEGASTPEQLEHATTLLAFFKEKTSNTIFSGDFNAPRGGKTFQLFADRWRDNIPAQYVTSLDPDLHKGGKLVLMVDGLFSDPEVQFGEVKLQAGVSDHMAVVALINE